MHQRTTPKDKHYYYNTLVGLLKALENKETLIDLRNESCVSGLIKHVDGYMNVDMENVVYYDSQGTPYFFRNFYVNGRTIRDVQIPSELNTIELLQNQIQAMRNTKRFPSAPKKGSKYSRALKQHKQTLEELQNQAGPSSSQM